MKPNMKTLALATLVTTMCVAANASAKLRAEGKWPDHEKVVTVRLDGSRADAVKKLAEAAGWSLLVEGAMEGERVDLAVKDQEPRDVLEALLAKGEWVATRKGALVTIERKGAAKPQGEGSDNSDADAKNADEKSASANGAAFPPIPPIPAIPPIPPVAGMTAHQRAELQKLAERTAQSALDGGKQPRGKDRESFGGNLRIGKDEVVHDLSVTGGNAEVYGTVTGDVSVLGGNVTLYSGAVVKGDVSVRGGNVTLQDGSRVEGDLDSAFGNINRQDHAVVLGDITERHGGGREDVSDEVEEKLGHPAQKAPLWTRAVDHVRDGLVNAAFFFVVGVLGLALAPKKLETLKVEIVKHPARSFALGLVAFPLTIAAIAILCVTIVGIPLGVSGAAIFALASITAPAVALATVGELIDHRRTKNAYVQLGTACILFFLVRMIPGVGQVVSFILLFSGYGAFVATRGLGLFDRLYRRQPSIPPEPIA